MKIIHLMRKVKTFSLIYGTIAQKCQDKFSSGIPMNLEIKNQPSTQRGLVLAIGALVSLVFEWFGHSSIAIMPIFVGLAGVHGLVVPDTENIS